MADLAGSKSCSEPQKAADVRRQRRGRQDVDVSRIRHKWICRHGSIGAVKINFTHGQLLSITVIIYDVRNCHNFLLLANAMESWYNVLTR